MESVKTRKTTIFFLLLILILALVLRGFAFLEFKDYMNLQYDPRNYWLMSHQLADKGIYGYFYDGNPYGGRPGESNARVMPGYPLLLTVVYKIVGDKYLQITAVRLIQIMLSTASCFLGYYFVKKMFKKDGIALLTALFMAVYPTYIYSCVQLLTEVTALFTMLLYLCVLYHAMDSGKAGYNLLAGVLFALHILVRPTLLPLFILPFIFALITNWINKGSSRNKFAFKRVFRMFILQLAGFVLIMLPWWIRNVVTLGSLIITAQASGNPLLGGTYPYFIDYFADVTDDIRGNNEKQMALGIKRIIEGFKNDFWLYLKWFTVGKIEYTFQKPYLYNLHTHTNVHFISHFFVLITGVLGMVWHSIKSLKGLWFYLYGLAILALQLLFIPDPRFAYLIFFFIITGAAHFIYSLFGLVTGKNKRGQAKA